MKFSFAKKDAKVAVDTARVVLMENREDDLVYLNGEQMEIRIGIGKREKMTRRKLMLLARRIVAAAKGRKLKKIVLNFPQFRFEHLKMDDGEIAELLAVNMEMANFQFVKFKTPPKEGQ